MSGQEVSEYQDYLISKGFLQGNSTGFFGLLTLQATKAYQTSVGLPSTGYVGSLTRGEVNKDIDVAVTSSNDAEMKETGIVTVLTSCGKGDLFDIKTGKPCTQVASSTIDLNKKIDDLNKKIDEQTKVIQTYASSTATAPVYVPPPSYSKDQYGNITEINGIKVDNNIPTDPKFLVNAGQSGDQNMVITSIQVIMSMANSNIFPSKSVRITTDNPEGFKVDSGNTQDYTIALDVCENNLYGKMVKSDTCRNSEHMYLNLTKGTYHYIFTLNGFPNLAKNVEITINDDGTGSINQ